MKWCTSDTGHHDIHKAELAVAVDCQVYTKLVAQTFVEPIQNNECFYSTIFLAIIKRFYHKFIISTVAFIRTE